MASVMDDTLASEDHFSCSEESDTLCKDRSSNNSQETVSAKLKESIEKDNLDKFKNLEPPFLEEKKELERLRSPVICVLGHVDTGKTKLLDFIRKTHVQDSEAGGITQQIGATMIPREALKEKCKMVKDFSSLEIKVPGLLVIDTPGHESFKNMRSRGSSICDMAILVVDIMHGLEPQTMESIQLLKKNKTPFVVALNKVDRLFGWLSSKDEDIENVIARQSPVTLMEFKTRCQEIVAQFANECLNATLFYENKNPRVFVCMVPVSAVTGDGMGNLLGLITHLTQSLMRKKLVFTPELQATVLEVKAIPGLGTTIDIILVNGRLQEGDTILLARQEGPFSTQIRSLLMPQPLKELRVKNPYVEYKTIEGAQALKITGKDLDKTVAGQPLYVATPSNQAKTDELKGQLSKLLNLSTNYIKTSERGVYVQASTLGSLEALLEYMTAEGVPYFATKIGPVVKRDVMKASVMLEHVGQFAVILAFDVKVERDAQELADTMGVKIFQSDIIYNLFDEYLDHKSHRQPTHRMVHPCILRLLPRDDETTTTDLLTVRVEEGTLFKGTPLCVPARNRMELGVVTSVSDGFELACAGDVVNVRLKGQPSGRTLGVDLEEGDCLVSRISKESIEVCRRYYRYDMEPEDWRLINVIRQKLDIKL